MLKNKIILILGTGQIGEACAIEILKDEPKVIVLHTLTKQEAIRAIENVKKSVSRTKSKLIPSWGNIFVPAKLSSVLKQELMENVNYNKDLLNYYYAPLSENIIKDSSLYKIIQKWKPDIIIDGINTATVVGYQGDPYSLPREIISKLKQNNDGKKWKRVCIKLLTSAIIPNLVRFTQVLQKAMIDFKIERYIKISTTGLGGMGINIRYTHGDLNEPGMSSGILGKVAAAGIMHQLFWGLSHTPGIDIKIVVPATLVGWQPVRYGKFRSHGKNLPLVDCPNEIKLKTGNLMKPNKCMLIKNQMEIPYVDSGENSAYSLAEMTAITALGQMGCVTREEVAQAVYEMANGSTKYDILTATDNVSLKPSFPAAFQREVVLQKLATLEKEKNVPSIATNNLGPTVSKHLFELYILLLISNNSMGQFIEHRLTELVNKAERLIRSNKELRAQILSLGFPILLEGKRIFVGECYFVPDIKSKNIISEKNIEQWAENGWVDLRRKQISYWQNQLKKVFLDVQQKEKSTTTVLNRNWQGVKNSNTGEILAYVYSLQGGERKVEY